MKILPILIALVLLLGCGDSQHTFHSNTDPVGKCHELDYAVNDTTGDVFMCTGTPRWERQR